MVYNDVIGKQGIVQDVYFEVNANSVSYPIEDLTRNANSSLDNVFSMILGSDGRWQFDSTNATDLPIGTTNLVNGQIDYSYDPTYMVIKSMEVSDTNGNWIRLTPIDNDDLLRQQAMTQFANGGGTPVFYDKMGESILLYPTPNYNLVNGLKAYFQRNIDYFTTTDTTKEPGFARQLHKYVSLFCSYMYACAKGLPKQGELAKRLEFYEGNKLRGGNDPGEFARFYSYREVDEKPRIKNKVRVKI